MTLLNEYKPTSAGISPLGEVPAGQGGKDFSSVSPLPAQEQDSGGQVLEFTGLDLTEKAGSGAFLECENVSTRNYPCLSPRIGRSYSSESAYQGVGDIFRFDGKTVYRNGTELYYVPDGGEKKKIADVLNGRKQFAVVNSRLTVWPDGVCIDLTTDKAVLLGAKYTVSKSEGAEMLDGNRYLRGTFADSTGSVTGSVIFTPSIYEHDLIRVPYYDTVDGEETKLYLETNTVSNLSSLAGKKIVPGFGSSGYEILYAYRAFGSDDREMIENPYGATAVVDSVTLKKDSDGDRYAVIRASVTVPVSDGTERDVIRSGDVVFLNGLKMNGEDVTDAAFRVWGVGNAYLDFGVNALTGYMVPSGGTVTVERRIPNLSFVCSSDNRLWGVSNEVENIVLDDNGNTVKYNSRAIFCSKLGDPANWYYYQGVSMDSWTAAVSSEGDFTGICEWSGDVLCFKEREMFRVTGSVPSAYTLYQFSVPGVEAGSGGSIAVIDEVVYYKSEHGVYRYSGGTPTRVSEIVADTLSGTGNAGTDGRNYFLSVGGSDNPNRGIYVYDTWNNAWSKHDSAVGRFASDGGVALFLRTNDSSDTREEDKNTISRMDGGSADGMPWSVTMHPDYGTTKTSYYSTALNMGYKYFKFVFLRGELFDHDSYHPVDAQGNPVAYKPYVEVWAKMGEGKHPEQNNGFEKIGTQTGVGKFVLRMPVSRYREDRIQLMLKGVGDCVLRDVRYVYSTGSEWIQSDMGGVG